jgi:hypothetical protein
MNDVIVIKTGKGEWGERLIKGLNIIEEDIIFYMQEDFWPCINYDINTYNHFFDKYNMNALRVCAKCSFYSVSDIESNLFRFNQNSPYLMSHQFSLWNKRYLLRYIDKNDTPWNNEINQTPIISRNEHKIYIIYEPFYHEVVGKSVIKQKGIEMINEHKLDIEKWSNENNYSLISLY